MKFVWEINADPRVKFYRKMQHVGLNRNRWNETQLQEKYYESNKRRNTMKATRGGK